MEGGDFTEQFPAKVMLHKLEGYNPNSGAVTKDLTIGSDTISAFS